MSGWANSTIPLPGIPCAGASCAWGCFKGFGKRVPDVRVHGVEPGVLFAGVVWTPRLKQKKSTPLAPQGGGESDFGQRLHRHPTDRAIMARPRQTRPISTQWRNASSDMRLRMARPVTMPISAVMVPIAPGTTTDSGSSLATQLSLTKRAAERTSSRSIKGRVSTPSLVRRWPLLSAAKQ